MFVDIVKALAFVGVPLGLFTFLMVYYAYYKGYLSPKHTINMAFEGKKNPNSNFHKKNKKSLLFLHTKWVSFGGGFYGLVALLTFIYIELKQVMEFLLNATGIQYFIDFVSLNSLIAMIVDSFINMVKAAIWFTYWPKIFDMNNIFIWGLVAYLSYRIGAKFAQRYAIKSLNSNE